MKISSSRREYEVVNCEVSKALDGFTAGDRLIIDRNVSQLWPAVQTEHSFAVDPGEASKCLETYGAIHRWLAQTKATRKSRVFAVGGGVVGDLAGFVASTYMRGIEFVMVPTTLLAMVDSSVGGKTAIDIPEGKNLVGTFWPPSEVRIATEFLETLPHREFLCGCAEVWKYGFIEDLELLATLQSNPIDPTQELTELIYRCIESKAKIVQEDEEETTGRRAVLNFGHTVGHAIEAIQEYRNWNHGEAVSAGMVVEAKLGEILGITKPEVFEQVVQGLKSQGLPVRLPDDVNSDELLKFVARDKKTTDQGLAFSLLVNLGECKLTTGVSSNDVKNAMNAL